MTIETIAALGIAEARASFLETEVSRLTAELAEANELAEYYRVEAEDAQSDLWNALDKIDALEAAADGV